MGPPRAPSPCPAPGPSHDDVGETTQSLSSLKVPVLRLLIFFPLDLVNSILSEFSPKRATER